MRGVLALAAAISLPNTLADGTPFPQRNLIIFLTFSVILVTLVLQGLTLPPLIRALGLAEATGLSREESEARRLILETALQHIEDQRPTADDTDGLAAAFDDLAVHYKRRLASITAQRAAEDDVSVGDHARLVGLSRGLLLKPPYDCAMKAASAISSSASSSTNSI
jgi:monovalent cation/hydrogen antiporter